MLTADGLLFVRRTEIFPLARRGEGIPAEDAREMIYA